jgi:hypothetical protein
MKNLQQLLLIKLKNKVCLSSCPKIEYIILNSLVARVEKTGFQE